MAPIALVNHHVEEILDEFTHVVMLRDDAVVSSSPRDETPPAANLLSCVGLDLSGEHREGRWFAWAR